MEILVYITSRMRWYNTVCKYKSSLSWLNLDRLSPLTLKWST